MQSKLGCVIGKLFKNKFSLFYLFFYILNLKGEIANEADCAKVRDQILSVDKTVHHVVSSLGSWWQKGVLSEQSVEEFNALISNAVISHFVVYKTFAKILASNPGSTYTFITGGSGESCEKGEIFFADASLIPVMSNAVYGLYDSAYSEFHNHPNLKVSQLRIFIWVRPKSDSNFDANTSQFEVGNDFIGRFIPKIIKKHRDGIFRAKSRQEANAEFENI